MEEIIFFKIYDTVGGVSCNIRADKGIQISEHFAE